MPSHERIFAHPTGPSCARASARGSAAGASRPSLRLGAPADAGRSVGRNHPVHPSNTEYASWKTHPVSQLPSNVVLRLWHCRSGLRAERHLSVACGHDYHSDTRACRAAPCRAPRRRAGPSASSRGTAASRHHYQSDDSGSVEDVFDRVGERHLGRAVCEPCLRSPYSARRTVPSRGSRRGIASTLEVALSDVTSPPSGRNQPSSTTRTRPAPAVPR